MLLQVFGHITEYVSKDCLDLLLQLTVSAAASSGSSILVKVQGSTPNTARSSSSSAGRVAAVVGSCWPVYVINDVNLMTVLETFKVFLG